MWVLKFLKFVGGMALIAYVAWCTTVMTIGMISTIFSEVMKRVHGM